MKHHYPLIDQLPITEHLDNICKTLKESQSRFLVLTAETGAGKSTAIPLALLENFSGKILMLEPRRIATIAVANRVAEILGEDAGETSGYVMQLEKKVSGKTRFTVMTEAVLTNMLLKDPSLDDINVVVIDEFHERSVNADLALAFLKEAMVLNENLYVIVMSATINAQQLSKYLSNAPIYEVEGRLFPVQIEYCPETSASEAIKNELSVEGETILAFFPGIADIRKCERELEETDAEILVLHSSIPFEQQKKILTPVTKNTKRRVILSSAIAETSITVPNVTTVIDTGYMRLNRMNVASGMETLVTERESFFSAKQRTGRAGRCREGRCIRLWNQNETLPLSTPAEILRSDLCNVVLSAAEWGVKDRTSLSLLDTPSENAWSTAQNTLIEMELLDKDKSITQKGKACLMLGISPRLACVAIAGDAQTALEYSQWKDQGKTQQDKFLQECNKRLAKCKATFPTVLKKWSEPLLAGFPDRLAKKTDEGSYQFMSGRIAKIREEDEKATEWIIATEVNAGDRTGLIYKYKTVSEDIVQEFLKSRIKTEYKIEFDKDNSTKIKKKEVKCYGKIVLSSKQVELQEEDYGKAICQKVQTEGLECLPLSKEAKDFLRRSEFYYEHTGDKSALDSILQKTEEWLLPFITGKTISEESVYNAIKYALDSTAINKNVPDYLVLPNGKKARLTYEKIATKDGTKMKAVMEIIIQQIFGCYETPKVMGENILLRLLSPARRPLQVTEDLEGFWNGTWQEICKEMKGRYPKHNWDYKRI